MKIDKKIMINDFVLKSYSEKREILLDMLRQLAGTTKTIDELGKMVYELTEENEGGLYLQVCEILVDAVFSVDNNNKQAVIDNLGKIEELLLKAKKEEEEEKKEENKNLENLFNDL